HQLVRVAGLDDVKGTVPHGDHQILSCQNGRGIVLRTESPSASPATAPTAAGGAAGIAGAAALAGLLAPIAPAEPPLIDPFPGLGVIAGEHRPIDRKRSAVVQNG